MTKNFFPLALWSFLALAGQGLFAITIEDPRTDTLAVTVSAIKEVATTTGTNSTTLSTGSQTVSLATLDFTSNGTRNLQAWLTSAAPTDLDIAVRIASPNAGTSVGWVTLTTSAQNIVTSIPAGATTGEAIEARATISGTPPPGAHNIEINFAFD